MSLMAPEDVVTLAGFTAVLICWGGYSIIRRSQEESPQAVMRRRAAAVAEQCRAADIDDLSDPGALLARPLTESVSVQAAIAALRARVLDFGGVAGLQQLVIAMIAGGVLAVLGVLLSGLPKSLLLIAVPVQTGLVCALVFVALRANYRRRFTEGFPEVLETIIRAVRAGVPVSVAIQTVGEEIPGPIGSEYKRMGDALRLGVDQSEVFDSASRRIGVPEFKFFAVCLELQRETGGPLSETLENLAAIIRARKDVRLKTRALTAEGRMASKVIASIPLAITGGLYLIGGDYIDVLIHTEIGHRLIAVAVGMIVLGQAIIFRMTKLEA